MRLHILSANASSDAVYMTVKRCPLICVTEEGSYVGTCLRTALHPSNYMYTSYIMYITRVCLLACTQITTTVRLTSEQNFFCFCYRQAADTFGVM